MKIENQTKTQVWEDSSLCPEISTKNAVQDFHLWLFNQNINGIAHVRSQRGQKWHQSIGIPWRILAVRRIHVFCAEYLYLIKVLECIVTKLNYGICIDSAYVLDFWFKCLTSSAKLYTVSLPCTVLAAFQIYFFKGLVALCHSFWYFLFLTIIHTVQSYIRSSFSIRRGLSNFCSVLQRIRIFIPAS
jgi:hypothetical protein